MADIRNKNRQSRLRAALRENLKRRKEQVRRRASQSTPGADERDEAARQAESDVRADDAPEKPA